MSEIFDDFKTFLPKHLSDDKLNDLINDLLHKREDRKFYTSKLQKLPNLFQGDGFSSILMPDCRQKKFKEVKALLISNTCDSNSDNARTRLFGPFVCFAPIVSLIKYEAGLLGKYDKNKVHNHILDIKNQKNTSFFFLPGDGMLKEDSFVRLDSIFSMVLSEKFVNELVGNRLFSLDNYGFYMLLFKLSVHFTRIKESIDRDL